MKLYKPYTRRQYAELASYCNRNGMIIEDKGDYLESVLPPPPTQEGKEKAVRAVRAQYFADYVDFYQSKPLYWEELADIAKQNISEYRVYLKDYTKEPFWYEQNPLSYEEWFKKKYPPEDLT